MCWMSVPEFTIRTEKAPFLRQRRLGPCSSRQVCPRRPARGGRRRNSEGLRTTSSFENFEGQDEISSEASAFQREEVELTKPFLIWHVTKTSH